MTDALFLTGDTREQMRRLPDGVVQTCVTSPPYYGLRDYGVPGQIGLEATPAAYVAAMVEVFREVRRVLRDDGTLWLNLGDSYAANRSYQVPSTKGGAKHGAAHAAGGTGSTVPYGLKPKDLIGIPWRVAFALQADGWYLRQDIIWHKPNPMPESVRDRCTRAHEHLFLLAKSERYYFDAEAIKEPSTWKRENNPEWQHARAKTNESKHPTNRNGKSAGFAAWSPEQGRNKRSVWTVTTKSFQGAHFATFPPDLIEPCILAGSKPGDVVLDAFGGAGTTALVARRHKRASVYIELNPAYADLARRRVGVDDD